MFTKLRGTLLGAAASTLLVVASAAWAGDTVVHVTLTGDGGEKMGLVLDTASVPAGSVEFTVKNDAMMTDHEMVVVKLKSKSDPIPMMTDGHRVDEEKLASMGEVSDLKPGTDGKLKVALDAGDYLLFCNLKGHYMAGMVGAFTVTK
jgi:uncharacterized cupredoxin-like copper-binding protein